MTSKAGKSGPTVRGAARTAALAVPVLAVIVGLGSAMLPPAALARAAGDPTGMAQILTRLSMAEARLRTARRALSPARPQTAALASATDTASRAAAQDVARMAGVMARLDGTTRRLDRLQQQLTATRGAAALDSVAAMARLVRQLDKAETDLTALRRQLEVRLTGRRPATTLAGRPGGVTAGVSLATAPPIALPKPVRAVPDAVAGADDLAGIRGQIGMTGLWIDATEARLDTRLARHPARTAGRHQDVPRRLRSGRVDPATGLVIPVARRSVAASRAAPMVYARPRAANLTPPPRKPLPPGQAGSRDALIADILATRYGSVYRTAADGTATAAPSRAPRGLVEGLHSVVLAVSRDHATLGFQGRRDQFRAVMADIFHFPKMTEFAMGPYWDRMNADQRQRATAGFTGLIIAMFADRFDFWHGQSFRTVKESHTAPQGDPVTGFHAIDTQLVLPFLNEKYQFPIRYIARKIGDRWWLVDVVPPGYSEVWARRAEYLAVLARVGVDGFLDRMAARMSAYDART